MTIKKTILSYVRDFIDHSPKIASLYRNIRDQMETTGDLKMTPWGFKLSGNSAMASGTFEPLETGIVRRTLEEVDILVNVGANIGYYCCHALSMGKNVIAFEPLYKNLKYLLRNIKFNGWIGVAGGLLRFTLLSARHRALWPGALRRSDQPARLSARHCQYGANYSLHEKLEK